MKQLLNRQGAAMVELAIAIPLFVAVLLAVIDFGLYFNNRIALQTAAYNYAKAAAVTCSALSPNDRDTILGQSVAGVISNTDDITILSKSPLGTGQMRRFRVRLNYAAPANPLLSTLTQNIIGLYPTRVNGVALCQ